MNWDDLKFFVQVAKVNNVTGAGEALRVSAATVSRKILTLENSLGTTLFHKKTNGYFLTEAGESLLPLALDTEARMNLIERQASGATNTVAGRVRLDCPELMGIHLIIGELKEFHEKWPDIHIDFINSAKSERLSQSQSDVLVRLHQPSNGAFTMRCVGKLEQALYCSHGYAEQNGLPTRIEELKDHSIIGWTEEMSHIPLARWIAEVTSEADPWLRAPNFSIQLKGAQSDLGIIALPTYIGAQCGLVRVLPDIKTPASEIWLLRNQVTQELARVDTVVNFLTDLFKRHADELHAPAAGSPDASPALQDPAAGKV